MLYLGTICRKIVVKNIRSEEDRTYTDLFQKIPPGIGITVAQTVLPEFQWETERCADVKAVWINDCKGAFTLLLEDGKRKHYLLVNQRILDRSLQ